MKPKPIAFECPECGQHLTGTQEHIGTMTTCPNCSVGFVVSSPPPQSAQSNAHERNPLLVPFIIVSALFIVTLTFGALYIASHHRPDRTFTPPQIEAAKVDVWPTIPTVDPSPLPPSPPPLELVTFDYSFEQGERSDFSYRITSQIRNSGDKDIKLVDASIVFSDLLGAILYAIKLDPDISIAVGSTVSNGGRYHINRFESEQSRMKDMKKEDVHATLIVRQLVFTDNSISTYTK